MVEDDLIAIQTEKEFKKLFKYYLEILEDLNLEKNQYEQIRKKILDHSNEAIRETLSFLNFFNFTINKEKVEIAAGKKKIIKKVIINPIISIQ